MEEKVFDALGVICDENHGTDALHILFVTSFIAPGRISTEVLSSLIADPERLACATELLENHSLIHSIGNKNDFILKRSVQNIIRTFAKELMIDEFLFSHSLMKLIPKLIDLKSVNHVLCLLTHATEHEELHFMVIEMRDWVLFNLLEQNRFQEAYEFSQMALNFLRNKLGDTHGTTLDFQYNITILLGRMGKFSEARKLLKPILKENIKSLDQKEALITRHALARHLVEQSHYSEALLLYEYILGDEGIWETTNTIALTAWTNYALVLIDMGKYSEALDISRNVLKRRIEISATEDGVILETREIIAYIIMKQGRFTKALEIYEDILYERRQTFGEFHLKTLLTKRGLAMIFEKQGEHDKALLIFLEVFNKLKEILGDSHPETLTARGNIAFILANKGEHERAYEIFSDVYEKFKVTLGERCKETLRTKLNIGLTLYELEKLNEAVKVLREVHEGYTCVFGSNHEDTKEVKNLIENLLLLITSSTGSRNTHESVRVTEKVTNICDQDYEQKWPLHYAAKNNNLSTVKELLKEGAMYSEEDCNNKTPAQVTSNEEIKHLFILAKQSFKDVQVGDNCRVTEHSSIVNTRDKTGYTLLHWAAYHGRQSIAKQLLEVGANVILASNTGETPLQIAVSKGHGEIVEIILQHVKMSELKQVLNAKLMASGSVALHVAARKGHFEIVKCLLKYGAVYNIRNKIFHTPWHIARDPSVLNLLDDIHDLFLTLEQGDKSSLRKLKRKKYDEIVAITGARDTHDHTLVQVAITNGHQDIAKELVEIIRESNQRITDERVR